ncbi:MAG: helix-turn-helix transcriptional regulator [Nitrospinae bacterium]|nr:helix-turn-helix transcriptional regulator [Nitrospinota bacterium]
MTAIIPDNFRKIRSILGLNRKKMGELVNKSDKSWEAYEYGTSFPGGEVFVELVNIGFNINWVLTGVGEIMQVKAPPPFNLKEKNGEYKKGAAEEGKEIDPQLKRYLDYITGRFSDEDLILKYLRLRPETKKALLEQAKTLDAIELTEEIINEIKKMGSEEVEYLFSYLFLDGKKWEENDVRSILEKLDLSLLYQFFNRVISVKTYGVEALKKEEEENVPPSQRKKNQSN